MASSSKVKVSLFKAPHAQNDEWSDGLEDTVGYIDIADLLANDLGGDAKSFYGLHDPADPTATSQTIYSELGAVLTVNADGTISYDAALSSIIQTLAAGETLEDSFEYIIQLSGGTLSKAVVYVTVTGENDDPVIDAASSELTAVITEIADGAEGEDTATHTASGDIV